MANRVWPLTGSIKWCSAKSSAPSDPAPLTAAGGISATSSTRSAISSAKAPSSRTRMSAASGTAGLLQVDERLLAQHAAVGRAMNSDGPDRAMFCFPRPAVAGIQQVQADPRRPKGACLGSNRPLRSRPWRPRAAVLSGECHGLPAQSASSQASVIPRTRSISAPHQARAAHRPLPILERDAPIGFNRRDLVAVHQWALRAAMSRIARAATSLPAAESSAGP